ncbi:hypothetical protein [Methanothermobacter sp.]|uniref:hypothetical protein n=1 Tax=Methanothermobacter sp. TaxID=1884223 RepID=UPI002614A9F4|nr:hypothetical protein [Methanothermobacter sp.]MDI9617741.1 hypothetical protein [Methanothermobacter sp.]
MLDITMTLTDSVIRFIEETGYPVIVFLMALESAFIPVPSEVIMPFSGYIAWQQNLILTGVVIRVRWVTFWVLFWPILRVLREGVPYWRGMAHTSW